MQEPAPDTSLPEARIHQIGLQSGRKSLIWHWPAADEKIGSIAFSHGSYSAPWKYENLVQPWREAGYDIWAPVHVDSADHPLRERYPMPATWMARLEDMRAVSALIGVPYVAAGHSYGALTGLVMGGADGIIPENLRGPLRDSLVRCVIALSPPPPMPGLIEPGGYAGLAVPALIQTGHRDLMPGWPEIEEGWRVHLPAYEEARLGGDRYLLVLDGVDHYFGNAIGEPGRDAAPQLEALVETVAISRLFMKAFFPDAKVGARQHLDARLTALGPARLEKK